MGRIERRIFRLLIVLITLLFMDGGISAVYPGINIQILNAQHHINDIELPGHHSHSHLCDYEKWAGSPEIDFSDYSGNFIKIPFNQNSLLSGVYVSIWQPPENS